MYFAREVDGGIPEGEINVAKSGTFHETWGGEAKLGILKFYHEWSSSYYHSNLTSYDKINSELAIAFVDVPYWEKEPFGVQYQLGWYDGAAETTLDIQLKDDTFYTLGVYQGYDVIDLTTVDVENVKFENGLPMLKVSSFHRDQWWGPYYSDNPEFFNIIANENGTYTYQMSDAWSPGSFDDAEFSITIKFQ